MLRFDLSDSYKGIGCSQGLDRGLLVYDEDFLLVEEGMGLGACALQTGGRTYFASMKDFKKAGDSFDAVYSIDMKLEMKILGRNSPLLTIIQEYAAKTIYMKHEKKQAQLLRFAEAFGKLLHVETCFVKVPSLGEVRVKYKLAGDEVTVSVDCEMKKAKSTLFILNELGGSLFDKSIINGMLSSPPSGWQKVKDPCELYSDRNMLSFTVEERHVPDNVTSRLFWGREQILDTCWAGFESEIICESGVFQNYIYSIKLKDKNEVRRAV